MAKWTKGEFVATVEDVTGEEHDLTIQWRGYYDPGNTSGPVERCYPEEGEIEIEVVGGLPEGVNFGDLDDLNERLEDWAWEDFMESRY